MLTYLIVAFLAALTVLVPWATQNLYRPTGLCEVQAWFWVVWGACNGGVARLVLGRSSVGAPPVPLSLLAVGATGSCAAFLVPPSLGAVPLLGGLYGAVAATFAGARTDLLAWETKELLRTGADWSLAADSL